MRPDSYVRFHTGSHVIAQYLRHTTNRLAILGRLFCDLNDHHLTFLCTVQLLIRNDHFMGHALIVRHQEAHAGIHMYTAHHIFVRAFNHLDQGTLAAPPAIYASNLHHGAIIMPQ